MKKHPLTTHKLVLLSMFLALAIALGVADYFIPFPFVPGAKLGLANIVILLVLYEFGAGEAALIDLGKVFVVGLVAGRIFQMGFWMSFAGSFLSWGVMVLLKLFAKKMTIVGISAMAAIAHGFGQIVVYSLFIQSGTAFYYFPLMCLMSILTGVLVGILAERIEHTGIIAREKKQYHIE